MAQYLVFLGLAFNLLGGLAYAREVLDGRAKPNRVTWVLWALAPAIAGVAAWVGGAGFAAIPVFGAGVGPTLIVLASFYNPESYWRLEKRDYLCGIFSILALLLWGLTKEPAIAVLFAILSDALAGVPTLIKTWKHPETEYPSSYIGGNLSVVTVSLVNFEWSFTTLAFPCYLFGLNTLFLFIIFRARLKAMKRSQLILLASMVLFPAVLAGAFFAVKGGLPFGTKDQWKTYQGEDFEFRYPAQLTLTEDERAAGLAVTLIHSVDLPHQDPCDFKGDGKPLEQLTDFHVTLAVVQKPIQKAAGQDLEALIPIELGALKGYQVEHSVEGCGFVSSYFDVGGGKTLAVDRTLVGELSSINAQAADFLKDPRVISPQEADAWWNTILATFKVK